MGPAQGDSPPPRTALLCVLQEVPRCLNTPDSLIRPFMPLLGGGMFPLFIVSLVTRKPSLKSQLLPSLTSPSPGPPALP